jgi:hypothetical protein
MWLSSSHKKCRMWIASSGSCFPHPHNFPLSLSLSLSLGILASPSSTSHPTRVHHVPYASTRWIRAGF